jgi:hypothetical protein
MEKEKEIPTQYQLQCNGCGKILDIRDASVILHGWIEGDEIICYDGDVPYSSSMKKGEPVLWDKEKRPIHLS